MLGALVGTLTGLSVSPLAKDIVIGLVALLGMFFGLRPKSESKDDDERTRSDFACRNDNLRLSWFCGGCIIAIGVAIRVRDTMWLIPLDERPFSELTVQQRADRIKQVDRLLVEIDPEGRYSPELFLGIQQGQSTAPELESPELDPWEGALPHN